jgi:hypothetical protein
MNQVGSLVKYNNRPTFAVPFVGIDEMAVQCVDAAETTDHSRDQATCATISTLAFGMLDEKNDEIKYLLLVR